jgi:NADPH-dependent FMN reductase
MMSWEETARSIQMRKDDVSICDPTIMSVSAPRNFGRNDRDEGAVLKFREEDGDMHLQIIVGSVREGRTSLGVGDWALAHIQHRNELTVELIDLKKWNLPMMDFAAPPAMGINAGGYWMDFFQRRTTVSRSMRVEGPELSLYNQHSQEFLTFLK